jgi:hypothetical protein
MSDQPENVELSEDQKLQDEETRRQIRLQLEESEKLAAAKKEKRLSSMSNQEFQNHTREKYGF